MLQENRNTSSGEVVAGYFNRTEDAQRAMDDLLDKGFQASQIGAAFCNPTEEPAHGASGEMEHRTMRSIVESESTGTGPASDTRAVTAAGLSPGSGGVISGPTRPGPIPGAEIPHHRTSGLPSSAPPIKNPIPATGQTHDKDNVSSLTSKSSLNFGTGEGHIAVYPESYEYEYSGSAFESAFSGMGVSPQHAKMIAGELRNGGAIITVNATGRVTDAEHVLEEHHGCIRYEKKPAASSDDKTSSRRVHVSGELSRIYPNYLAGADVRSRKAS
jgi:hypothetical protein